jgi:hypothetical protein
MWETGNYLVLGQLWFRIRCSFTTFAIVILFFVSSLKLMESHPVIVLEVVSFTLPKWEDARKIQTLKLEELKGQPATY